MRGEFRQQVGEPGDLEDDLLDLGVSDRRDCSRLSCQIKLTEALDGLTVSIPPSKTRRSIQLLHKDHCPVVNGLIVIPYSELKGLCRRCCARMINDLLTQTGPDTPMGQLFRRYWMPALLAEELPENDCPPVRVKLLSERLIAFRDSRGALGLMDEFCAHRGVSLWFGRNEECGLRCPYHGWKYDVTGQCIEMPSEPVDRASARRSS